VNVKSEFLGTSGIPTFLHLCNSSYIIFLQLSSFFSPKKPWIKKVLKDCHETNWMEFSLNLKQMSCKSFYTCRSTKITFWSLCH
jgi:hypothetical protein